MNIKAPSINILNTSLNRFARCTLSIAFALIFAVNARTAETGGVPGPQAISGNNNDGNGSGTLTLDSTTLSSYGLAVGIAGIMMNKAGIENATVDANNVVRVEEQSKARAGGIFEAHYFLSDVRKKAADQLRNDTAARKQGLTNETVIEGTVISDLAHGPVFVVELGQNVIRSVGLGYLWSFRDLKREVSGKTATITTIGRAFNLGVVALMEPNVKVLGAGLTKNAALPAGDAIRFDHEAHYGAAVLLSWGF
ncbi:MAG: hypothetical protein WC378_09415 [Opitutaceae bacterium]|jgi:hypothetical protein